MDKEGRFLGIKLHKFTFFMLRSNFLEMHINNFTTFKIIMIEMDTTELSLGNILQKFRFNNFSVFTIPKVILLSILFLTIWIINNSIRESIQSFLLHLLHNFPFIFIKVLIIITKLVTRLVFLFFSFNSSRTLLSLHILVILLSLIFNGLSHCLFNN